MAFDAFLKVKGIAGESKDDAHADWIEILSYSHGVNQPTSASPSSGGGATSERCNHSDFSIVKAIDKASVPLVLACCDGTHLGEVLLELCRSGGNKEKYMTYKLTNVVVSNVRPGGASAGGETLPLEEISFNYGKIEWEYKQQKRDDGTVAGSVAGGWDLQLNKKV